MSVSSPTHKPIDPIGSADSDTSISLTLAEERTQKVASDVLAKPCSVEQPDSCKGRIWRVLNAISSGFWWVVRKIKTLFQNIFGCAPPKFQDVSDLVDQENKLRKEISSLKFDKASDLITFRELSCQLNELEADVLNRQNELENYKTERKKDLLNLSEKSPQLHELKENLKNINTKLKQCEEKLGKLEIDVEDDSDDEDDGGRYGLGVFTHRDAPELQKMQKELTENKAALEEKIARIQNIPSKEKTDKILEEADGWEKALSLNVTEVSTFRGQIEEAVQKHQTEVLKYFDELQKFTLAELKKTPADKAAEDPTAKLEAYCRYWQMVVWLHSYKVVNVSGDDHQAICKIGGELLWKKLETVRLPNIGNTCWMNSTLQALLVFKELIEKGGPHPKQDGDHRREYLARVRVHNAIINTICEIWKDGNDARSAMVALERIWADPSVFPDIANGSSGQQHCPLVPLKIALGAFGFHFNVKDTYRWMDAGEKVIRPDYGVSWDIGIPSGAAIPNELPVQALIDHMAKQEVDDARTREYMAGKPVDKMSRHVSIENTTDIMVLGFNLTQRNVKTSAEKKRNLFQFLNRSQPENVISTLSSESESKAVEEAFVSLKEAFSKKHSGKQISDEVHRKHALDYCKDLGLLPNKEELLAKFFQEKHNSIRRILNYTPDDKMHQTAAKACLKLDSVKHAKAEQLVKYTQELEKGLLAIKPSDASCNEQILQLFRQHKNNLSSLLEVTVSSEDYIDLNFDEVLNKMSKVTVSLLQPGPIVPEQINKLVKEQTDQLINQFMQYEAAKVYFIREDKNVKVTSPLKFPKELTLPEAPPNNKYEVMGCICHYEDSPGGDHYIACRSTYDPDQNKWIWREYNDNQPVKVLTEEEITKHLAKASQVLLKKKG